MATSYTVQIATISKFNDDTPQLVSGNVVYNGGWGRTDQSTALYCDRLTILSNKLNDIAS